MQLDVLGEAKLLEKKEKGVYSANPEPELQLSQLYFCIKHEPGSLRQPLVILLLFLVSVPRCLSVSDVHVLPLPF